MSFENAPLKHIAFIMDGNGRWAKKRLLSRSFGHREGVKTLERVVDYCAEIGIKYVTVYALSTENLARPEDEVRTLLELFKKYIDDGFTRAHQKQSQIIVIGDTSILGEEYMNKAKRLEKETEQYEKKLIIAFNYGSRAEIVRAAKMMAQSGDTDYSEKSFAKYLYTSDIPDPDLIVRSAGEERLSNFLLWQAAYSEFYFTDTLWPDFDKKDVDEAVSSFMSRKRNFGKVPK
jgi:undecaprenyl diphosphate synthase